MVLQFTLDPATGVYKPPVTVFNGGKRKSTRRAARKLRKVRKTRKAKVYRRRR